MYSAAHQFEPLLPSPVPPALLERTGELVRASLMLVSAAHPTTRLVLAELVRSMNSYYSNRIEGQGTHPLNIERALKSDFSAKPDVARLQRLAVAYRSRGGTGSGGTSGRCTA